MNDCISEDSTERTIAACAFLVDIAQRSVDHYGWDPVIVRYLESLGQAAYRAKLMTQGGMGAVATMERSAAAVDVLAHTDAGRVMHASHPKTLTPRFDRQSRVRASARSGSAKRSMSKARSGLSLCK